MSSIDDAMNGEQERAFIEWRDLRAKAIETGDKADAHAAGKAFATFFYTYVANTYRPSALPEADSQ
ncbi:hypothetical protein ASD50_15150 [Mesorhizobium sp. Root552]|uniref:hypothetical protein n=1 Tax=Mesorhizobium sp. Root552 TaxID=1736555 RepID=UPI0006F8E7C0|nr:hypothetical protein [Mesorhizobium sp. Root552]KQZ31599.1 hypothetical protein ASD50_15150 [Mesorhizobium sp. Root552]